MAAERRLALEDDDPRAPQRQRAGGRETNDPPTDYRDIVH
jgi:hypothetical protein